MTAYLSDKPIFSATGARRMSAIPSVVRPGYTLWLFENGEVLSIQPDGSEQTRPPGTDGGYEQSLVIGTRAIWDYNGIDHPVMYDCVIQNG